MTLSLSLWLKPSKKGLVGTVVLKGLKNPPHTCERAINVQYLPTERRREVRFWNFSLRNVGIHSWRPFIGLSLDISILAEVTMSRGLMTMTTHIQFVV